VFPEHGNTVEALRQMADGAMYSVKKSGKNGYAFAERDAAPAPSE
jgi:GGDEF domain-containing protein